jgi:hypothetical protein
VITEDDVMRLLERADPVRDRGAAPAVDAAGYLDAALHARSTTLTLIDTEPTPTEPTSGRRRVIVIAGAAAAVVAIVAAGLVLAARGDDRQTVIPAAAPPPEEVARGFLDAYGAFDAERALTYLTDEAIARLAGTAAAANTRDEFRLELALLEAQGYKQTITGCEPQADSASGTTVRCSYDFHGIRSDEMGLGPYSDNYWDLTVRDGKLVSATSSIAFMTNGFSEQVWEPFAEWVATAYPDDVVRMYDSGSQTDFRLSEESIQLWEQRSREYAAAQG